MKIALVCPYDIAYPGGVTNHVTQFAQYARKVGHDVAVIAPTSRKGAYEGVISSGKAIPFPIKGGTVPRLSFSFWNYPEIRKLFVSEKFDVIHVHEPGVPLLGFAALACAPQRLSAIAATFHTNAPYNFLYKTYGKVAKLSKLADKLLRKVDVKIAVSEAAKMFASRYVTGEYCIIPNGVDVEHFSPETKPIGHYRDGKVNILFVGRLGNYEKRKGLKYLVSAFNKLHANHPNARLLVVGPGKPQVLRNS
ncbi:glycosyltransferase family 4 protein [Candidatus Woesearchaeota archaeon]|nr:glycosyltransferase family 4 protein [Candidatus Woesearchaeota archaeon]